MITLGFDTEFAIVDTKGNAISMVGKVGGTKKDPMFLTDFFTYHKAEAPINIIPFINNYYVQEDNVFVELNTPAVDTFIGTDEIMRAQLLIAAAVTSVIHKETTGKKSMPLKSIFGNGFFLEKEELQTDQAQTFGWINSPLL